MSGRWQLGDRVTSPTRLMRRLMSESGHVMRKTWERSTLLGPVTGILIGTRTLQNGYREWVDEEVGHIWQQRGGTVRAALIVTALHRKPVLVPLDSLQGMEATSD